MTMEKTALLMERHRLRKLVARREARIDALKREKAAADNRLFDIDRLLRIIEQQEKP